MTLKNKKTKSFQEEPKEKLDNVFIWEGMPASSAACLAGKVVRDTTSSLFPARKQFYNLI